MYLSRVQVLGFKSFAQKTKLDFNDGLSCIIGPNGSGKSNIVDAIRWVLGEQRVSSLRSDKMENVIFNGTKSRKPMGLAEVSLTIQNNKKILKTEFDEVVVSRRLYRSGESQYLINKTPVRLKDVLDLFMDTGMGANSYSVIELKMVESILSENKSERRTLFEEAAGVVKYKIRRRSALRKLDATRTDLTRLEDIISEVDKVVRSLSRQVGKTRRYLEYTEELKKTEIDLSRFRYHRHLDDIRPLEAQLQEISKIKEESHHQITIDEALLEDYKRELIQIEQELQKINEQLHQFDTEISRINQDEAVAQTKSEEISKAKLRYLQDIEDLKQKIKLLNENAVEHRTELDTLNEQKIQVDTEYQNIEQQRADEITKNQTEKQEIDRLNNKFRSELQALTAQKELLKQNELRLGFVLERLNILQEGGMTHADAVKKIEQQLKENAQAVEQAKTGLSKTENDIKTTEDTQQALAQKLADLESHKNAEANNAERIQSRINFLEQIIANYEGFAQSTQYVMQQKTSISGIHGTLSDLLSIDDKYAPLLEIILSDTLNYVIVDDVSKAKEVISLVRSNEKGRITLIPLDQINALEVNVPEHPSQNAQLFSSLLKVKDKYRKLIDLLLGDTAVVDDFEQAMQLSERYPGFRYITPNGESINLKGGISGGSSSKKGVSVVGRKDQLDKLFKELDNQNKKIESLEKEISDIITDSDKNNESIASLRAKWNQQRDQLFELNSKHKQWEFELSQHQKESGEVTTQLENLRKEKTQIEEEITTLSVSVDVAQLRLDKLEQETISRTSEFEKKSESLQILVEEAQAIQIKVSNLNNQVFNRKSDIERIEKTTSDHEETIKLRQNEIEQIERTLVQISNDSESRRAEQVKIWEQRDQAEAQHGKTDTKFHEFKDKILHLENETRKYRRQHDSTLERSRSLELQINENKFKAEHLREYILKEYAEDIEIGIPFEGLNEQESDDRIEALRTRIKNIGPVNPLAVQEYDKENERLEFLTKQRDDLLNAEKSLLETIDKINKTARKQFLDTFDAIRVNFENVFFSFFENGEGTLQLEDGMDPLEADIEIKVKTKGKRLQTLALLSGGEKTLTAISLLFAIYLVKPSPFCILDEVDAPLDDVNIGRFTEALNGFSDNTQFIVVTHNKRTMESAETMYGVTMEEEGVSKLVSVKFN